MKKILFFVFLFSGSLLSCFSQQKTALTKDQIKQAKSQAGDYFKNENYKEALKGYQLLQNAESDNIEFNYRLGVCYILTNIDKKKSVEYLKNVAGKKDAPKETDYYLGIGLMYNNEFNDAIASFEKYKELYKGKTNAEYKVDLHIDWCKNAMELINKPVDVRFDNPGKNVNSMYNDYRPVVGANDTIIYFSSNRKGSMGGIVDGFGEFLTDIYFAAATDTSFTKAKNAGTNLNSEGYNEVLYITMNGDKMLVYNEGGTASGDIYYTELKGKQWNKPVMMGETFETKEKERGAAMTTDTKTIYFSADLKGTKGGNDIWKIEKDTSTGKWGEPINLGDNVNTKYDEINPFLFYDGKTLFFASEGHNSMGGFDLFKTVMPDPRQGWSKAENLGYPLNSVYDDQYISVNGTGKVAYVSALREDGVGELDIYKVTCKNSLVSPQPVLLKIKALNTAGLPAREAICIVTVRGTGELVGTFTVSATSGLVSLSLLPDTYRVKVRSQKMGKTDDDITISGDEPGFVKRITYTLK